MLLDVEHGEEIILEFNNPTTVIQFSVAAMWVREIEVVMVTADNYLITGPDTVSRDPFVHNSFQLCWVLIVMMNIQI